MCLIMTGFILMDNPELERQYLFENEESFLIKRLQVISCFVYLVKNALMQACLLVVLCSLKADTSLLFINTVPFYKPRHLKVALFC